MPERSHQSIVRFDHVTVAFGGEKAIEDMTFEVLAGQTRILFGAAGSGKTTLLKTALGLLKPDAGRVSVFGQDITAMREQELFDIRSRVGVLFQEGGLFDSLTIEDNVAYPLVNQRLLGCPPEDIHRRAEEALRFVELEQTLEKFPSELSGGMRRRVGIARAVVTEPALVLYDSPTAGLDPITAYTIIALIVKERDFKNTTTMMATHRFQDGHFVATSRYNPSSGQIEHAAEAPGAGTVFMVLREGRLVFEGPLEELVRSDDSYISKFVKREE